MTDQIITERLTLRPYRADDAQDVATLIGDFAVSKWLTRVPYPYTQADALAFIERNAGTPFVYAVTRDGVLIGCVSIMGADLGYWYGVPYWGQGYATEAACAAVDAYFATEAEPLGSGYLDGNAGSKRVLEKLGFTANGMIQSDCLARQAKVVNHRMILCRETWAAAA
ncbi:GNAT family N-acetyltransferase [Tateyamaria sp. SN6-1]|uniref:GNAT family N-acetyltransferase n=1 Tax=Tateyamaria sp. SN6-1 TaxID=3092148 RepID=UPI0039F4817E